VVTDAGERLDRGRGNAIERVGGVAEALKRRSSTRMRA
jgi:hypothetical protein